MDSKIQPLKIYITTNINDQKNESDYTNEETNQNQNQGEQFVVVEPLYIVETIQQITSEDLLTNKLKNINVTIQIYFKPYNDWRGTRKNQHCCKPK